MSSSSGIWSRQPRFSKTGLLKLAVGFASAGVAGSVAYHHKGCIASVRMPLNSTVIETMAGAAGEVSQMALLYPLDTVKVRCQAASMSSRKVLAEIYRSTGGNWPAIIAALYAGILPGIGLSVVVGGVHYACFCATRRVLTRVAAAAATNSSSSSQEVQQGQGGVASHVQHVIPSHGATGTHYIAIDEHADEQGSQQQQQHHMQQPNTHPSSNSAGKHNSSSPAAAAEVAAVSEGSLVVNVASAVLTAALTAVFEAPLELFRHNSQAGQIQGNFVKEMWKALRKSGPRALYYGMVPYCLESWPYDISELVVVGAAKDMRTSISSGGSMTKAQDMQWDLATGAVGGTVAVLVSMPFDVVKTYMQTHGTGMDAVGLKASAAAFWQTGRQLVARDGPRALFVGLAPRLAHQVPGAMVCWLVVGSSHGWLVKAAESQHRHTAGASAADLDQG